MASNHKLTRMVANLKKNPTKDPENALAVAALSLNQIANDLAELVTIIKSPPRWVVPPQGGDVDTEPGTFVEATATPSPSYAAPSAGGE